MLTNSSTLSSRMLVHGLVNKPQYHGCEGVVIKMHCVDDPRMCVRLHGLDGQHTNSKVELRLKPENVRTILSTAEKRREQFQKIQTLTQAQFASQIEAYRIQHKEKGAKHTNAAPTCHALEMAYLDACKLPEAMEYLIKTDKMLRRVGSHDQDQARLFSQDVIFIKKELTRFESGIMSAADDLHQDKTTRCRWPHCLLHCRHAMARVVAQACRPRRCCQACAYGAFSMSLPRLAIRSVEQWLCLHSYRHIDIDRTLEIIIDLPIGFPINNIISLDRTVTGGYGNWYKCVGH